MPSAPSRTGLRLTPRSAGTKAFLLAFVGFFLLGSAWSVAMPYDGSPDEFRHVVRAYGVLDGQIGARADAHITVPQSLVPTGIADQDAQSCMRWKLDVTAACVASPAPGDEHKMVVTSSGAANYDPIYYAVAGWPIKLFPNYSGIIAARLLTCLLTSVLLGGAVGVATRLARGRGPLVLGGVLLAVTPVAVNLTGAVNPAGPEIAAAVAVWTSLIAILLARDDSKWTLALFGVSAGALAVLRELGIGWLVAALVVVAFTAGKERLRELARRRSVQIWSALVVVATVVGAAWILLSTQSNLPTGGQSTAATPHGVELLVKELTHRVPFYTNGLVGLTSFGDVAIPLPLVLAWFAAVGAVLVTAARRGGVRVLLQLAAIVGGSYLFLIAADLRAASTDFWFSQGRYALPMLVGAPILAGYVLADRGLVAVPRQVSLTRWAAWILIPTQGVALWITMIRFQHAFHGRHPNLVFLFGQTSSVNPFSGAWTPPGSGVPAALLAVAGIVVLLTFVLRAARSGPISDVETVTIRERYIRIS
ncbi:conserved hypothetical protein [Catenulispora acidiphila DSM 44928]|uniref:Glycosyltransferase RgtA/B/C/D-like domain-containing protein n=1 Tax=Catenulispora acidiphila (strain DSM 44928 / JCM 14897 / NBRC 102108 / NRRL B-24433 / ID139908) TaxID=479433 RepID=C7QIV4_CATAD|nr:DUF2142 domain-containing protein [Catenulispora acidiphila]ACU77004.1 conserved hypothetical protein [Catenulispora acidiphila DSM 44928]